MPIFKNYHNLPGDGTNPAKASVGKIPVDKIPAGRNRAVWVLVILPFLVLTIGAVFVTPIVFKPGPNRAALPSSGKTAPTATTAIAPTATRAPLPTNTTVTQPTATAAPVVDFRVTPTSFLQQCTSPADPLPALAVTLDNGGSNTAIGYQVTNVGTTPNGREPWAAASPATGAVNAGQRGQLTLTPIRDLCSQFGNSKTPVSFSIGIQLSSGGGGTTTITDSVTPFFIG